MTSRKPPLDSAHSQYSFGNQGLGSRDIFRERDLFNQSVFPSLLIPNYFDFWSRDYMYGRINTFGNVVYARESSLKQLRYAQEEKTYFAMNFVADAWRDFCDKIRDLHNKNIISTTGPYSDMSVAKSWRSPISEYHNYMVNDLFPVFSNVFMSLKTREDKTKNFGTFLKTFSEFADIIMREVGALTYSGFLESGATSPFCTGLVIEISYDNHNDDFNKLNSFFYDENFFLVSTLATQYGFAIDKNAPWRFVADLKNEAMQEYIYGVIMSADVVTPINDLTDCDDPIVVDDVNRFPEAFGFSSVQGLEGVVRHAPGYRAYRLANPSAIHRTVFRDVFTSAYREPWNLDIPLLEAYLLDFYNRHIAKKPYYEEESPMGNVCNVAQTVLKRRNPAEKSVYDAYSKKWALKTFYLLRTKEKKLNISVEQRKRDLQRIFSIYGLMAGSPQDRFEHTLRYIQENILPPTIEV